MTPLQIYIWQQADSIRSTCDFFGVFGFIGIIAVAGSYVIKGLLHDEEGVQTAVPKFLPILWFVMLFGNLANLIAMLMPSSKTIALMVALPAIANSEPIQKDLPELYKLAVDALKQQITGGEQP